MIVAVTGAEGFLGNNICRSLLADGHKVKAMHFGDPKALDGLNIQLFEGDITKLETLYPLIENADVVINSAGSINMDDSYETLEGVHLQGVKNILTASLKSGVKKVIHVSSIQALEMKPLDIELDETREYVGSSAVDYDRSKADADRIILDANGEKIQTLVVMPAGMYGPHDYLPTFSGKFLIDLFEKGKPLPSAGGYNWVDVRDVSNAISQAVVYGRPGEKYILSGEYGTMLELGEIIEDIYNKKVIKAKIPIGLIRAVLPIGLFASKLSGKPPTFTKARLDSLFINEHICNEKAKKELNFNPRPLPVTLKQTYAWFRSRGYMK